MKGVCFDGVLAGIAERSARKRKPGDYESGGLLYCGACRTPKQCRVRFSSGVRVVGCLCACGQRRFEAEEARRKQDGERIRINALRLSGIADKGLRECRFDRAGDSPVIQKCRRYAAAWDRVRAENIGLLLWGDTGGGKTYAAACVANALIDTGIPAVITSFPRILAAPWEERAEFLRQAGRFPLLVLDDLGAERGSEAALETVYNVVNERYKSGKPLIVTTNLPLQALQEPESPTHKRIYERLTEMCTPVRVVKSDYRKAKSEKKMEIMREILR